MILLENMFGFVKHKLKAFIFHKEEQTAQKVCEILFSLDEIRMIGFFRLLIYYFH